MVLDSVPLSVTTHVTYHELQVSAACPLSRGHTPSMDSTRSLRTRCPPLSRVPITMQERNNLMQQQESQAGLVEESTAEFSGEESLATSEDDIETTVNTGAGEMSLLDILKSIPATQGTNSEDEVQNDEVHPQCMCIFL